MGLKRGRGREILGGDQLFRKSVGVPQLTPQKFRRQLKTVTLKTPVQADYNLPTGLNGDRVYVDLNQNDNQYEGATLTTVDEILLTRNDLISYKRTNDAQTETVSEQLVQETDPPPPLSAFVTTMTQEAIGNGKSLLTYGVVPSVFPNSLWEVNRPSFVPELFTALIPTQEYTFTEAGFAGPIPLPLPFGTLSASDEQIDEYRHRLKRGTQNLVGLLPITIDSGSRTTSEKQVEHIQMTLEVDTTTPTPPTALLDVTFKKFGDGTALEEHDYVDFLFTKQLFDREIADVVPHRFKALVPIQRQESVIEGIATDPTLVPGDLKRTSEQVNVFVVKNTRQFRDITVLPVQQVDYKTTAKLQVSTVTNRLASGLQTLTPDYTWIDGSVEDLGNTTSLSSIQTVAPADFFEERSYERQIPDLIPEKYRPLTPTKRQSYLAPGQAADRNLVTGELSFASGQVNAYVKKEDTTFRDTVGLPVSLTDYELTREKQISTVIGTLNTGLQTLTGINELTDKASVENLGNGLSLKMIGTVLTLYDAESFGKQIPDPIPEKFRVIVPTRRHEYLVADTSANDRNLITGELSYTSERINAYVVRETSVARNIVTSVSLPGSRMTAQGQVADVIATLAPGLQTISPDFTFIEAEVENLGNGTSLLTQATVPDAAFPNTAVFPDDSYTTSILNLIPEKLRAAIKMTESSIDSKIPPFPSTNPTLLPGELERTEKRIGVYRKRIMIKSLGTIPGGGVTVTDEGFTTENGGGTTTTTHTLNTHGSLPVEVDQFILKCEVIDLGNGYDVRSTERADNTTNWPTLHGQEYDERLDVILPFTTRTRQAGTDLNTARMDIKPRDQWKQDERQVDLTAVQAVLDAYVMSYPSKVNIDMPDKLVGVQGIIETALGQGSNSETGSIGPNIGAFSISMALRASAQSSASMIPDATPEVVQFWGNQIDCTHYHFFLPNPVTPSAVLTKLATLVGTVSNWPKFAPKSVTIVARGEKASAQATASSQGSYSISASGQSSTTAGGMGSSQEHAVNLKTIRIPPTIHGALSILTPVTGSQPIHVSAHANAGGLGIDSISTPPDDSVTASIYVGTPGNTNIAATAGATDWPGPSAGKFLYRVDAQPYRYGYVQFHVIIVDAASFPPS